MHGENDFIIRGAVIRKQALSHDSRVLDPDIVHQSQMDPAMMEPNLAAIAALSSCILHIGALFAGQRFVYASVVDGIMKMKKLAHISYGYI
jgi:hypothetical protein